MAKLRKERSDLRLPRVSISMQREADQRSMMPEIRGKLNQYLLATSETEEKDYGISARRRRQSPEPAKEQPRQSLRRIQHTGLSLPMYIYMFFQTQIVNLYRFLTTQTRKFTSLRKPYMYICRNKLVYYHIVKDFGRIYFSLLKCKNSYTKWSKVASFVYQF